MPKLIKNGEIGGNSWQRFSDAQSTDTLNEGQWLVPLETYLSVRDNALEPSAEIGILLPGEVDVVELAKIPKDTPVIAIVFGAFTDGRGFSIARSLREHHDYTGDLRAVGNFMVDQLFYLARCGFSSFEIADDTNPDTIKTLMSSFSVKYQAAIDEPQPLFRRRS